MTTSASTSVPPFDFHSYLLRFTRQEWTILQLAGGDANHTVRALRSGKNALGDLRYGPIETDKGYLDGHTSIVLKQAPPYFVKFPDTPFSQSRQVSISL
jgi:hypothetical protein